jgi:hypothetical protein
MSIKLFNFLALETDMNATTNISRAHEKHILVTLVLVGTIQQFSICELSKSSLQGLDIALDIHKKIHHGFMLIRFMQALYTLHLTAEHQNSTHINPLPPLHLQG